MHHASPPASRRPAGPIETPEGDVKSMQSSQNTTLHSSLHRTPPVLDDTDLHLFQSGVVTPALLCKLLQWKILREIWVCLEFWIGFVKREHMV